MTNVISTVYNVNHKADSSSDGEAKVEEGKQIIAKISALKSGMGKNAIMELVIGSTILRVLTELIGLYPMTEVAISSAITKRLLRVPMIKSDGSR